MAETQNQHPLVTVRETFDENVRFLIPDYQRGYKWTVSEVRKLLEDVYKFSAGNGLKCYCLQNLTLVSSDHDTNLLRVVDGQQRLTTSSIIISYLRHRGIENLPPLRNGKDAQLSFGERKKTTTQPFFVSKILDGGIWKDVEEQDIVEDNVWMSSKYVGELAETLHGHFETWLELCPEANYDHSDIFHMFCAAMTVAAFFEANDKIKKPVAPCDFAAKFLGEVSFLHNIVVDVKEPGSTLEAEVFSKINGFRVPLDGADLLRAIFITYAVDKDALQSGLTKTEREVRLSESRVMLGLELDAMSNWWQEPRHQTYFAMFDPYVDNVDVNTSFDSQRYPINILYRLFAASRNVKSVNLDWFQDYQAGISTLYRDIRHFHSVLKDWYDNIKLYHYAGFLVEQCGNKKNVFANNDGSLAECGIYNLLERCVQRFDLFQELKRRMFLEVVRVKDEDTPDSSPSREKLEALKDAILNKKTYDWYTEEAYSVKKVLVLLDVIAFVNQERLQKIDKSKKKCTPLADRLDPEFFSCKGEDREHIFPQTPISKKEMKSPRLFKIKMSEYWGLVCEAACGFSVDTASPVFFNKGKELLGKWSAYWAQREKEKSVWAEPLPIDSIDDEWIEWLRNGDNTEQLEEVQWRINDFVKRECKIDLNSIGNLVMLDSGINRGYGNGFFSEKRKEIWAKYRACQPVRLHTYRAFAKEFGGDESGLDAWRQSSIVANRTAIANEIEAFFADLFKETVK